MLRFSDEENLWGKLELKSKYFQYKQISVPKYVFDDNQSSSNFPTQGITNFGPFDYNTSNFDLKRKFDAVKIIPFVPKNNEKVKNSISKLLEYLKSGYFEQRRGPYGRSRDIDFRGFKEEFRLADSATEDIIEYDPGNLSQAIAQLGLDIESLLIKRVIPICIIGGSSHRSYNENREIYLEAKREFVKNNLPSQFASWYEPANTKLGILPSIESLSPFGYSLWNFAINLYGKCGGMAWTILQSLSGEKLIDLTVGLRFVGQYEGEKRGYFVGRATIFDHYGKFLGSFSSDKFGLTNDELKTKGMVVPDEIMKKITHDIFELCTGHHVVGERYSKKDSLNIAIHRQSIFHENEINGIDSAIAEQNHFSDIKYGLVAISNEPYIMMESKVGGNQVGQCMILNNNSAILYTAKPFVGYPVSNPLSIVAQNLGTNACKFSNMEEVCQHVMDLTSLHWQTTNPNSVHYPCSLQFASEIGRNIAQGIAPDQKSWLWNTNWFL